MSELSDATDALREALEDAEDAIHSAGLGVSASIPFKAGTVLAWGKRQGEWRLLWHSGADEIPINKAPREVRVLAAHALHVLFKELRAVADGQAEEVREAIAAAKAFAAKVRHGRAER